MENAADALKLAFGVAIFVVAMAILFSTVSLAQRVATTLVTEVDEQTYIVYDEADIANDLIATDSNGVKCREVTLKDIIPTIYRYSSESYGVTIIDKSKNRLNQIVARFDTATETLCNTWRSDNAGMEPTVGSNGEMTYGEKQGQIKHLNNYVLAPVGAYLLNETNSNDLKALFQRLYKYTGNSAYEFYCPWLVGNNSNEKEKFVAQRINSDLSRKNNKI